MSSLDLRVLVLERQRWQMQQDLDVLEGALPAGGVQPHDATLDAFAALVGTPNTLPYFTATEMMSLTAFTAYSRTLLDDPDAATWRSTLGLGTMAVQDAGAVAITGGTASLTTLSAGATSLGNTTINTLLGIGYAPNASYNLYTGSARFTATVYGESSFDVASLQCRGNLNIINNLAVGSGQGYQSGYWSSHENLYCGANLYVGTSIDCNTLTVRSGNNYFGGLIGIYYAADSRYWLRCPSAFFDSIYVGGYVDMYDINVRAGGYIAGPQGIGRVASPSWSLCVGNMYADTDVQANAFYARDYMSCSYLTSRTGNFSQFNGGVGIGMGSVGFWLQAANIYSAGSMYGAADINTASLNVRADCGISGNLLLNSYTGDSQPYYKWLVSGSPAWDWCRVVAVHYLGAWAGIQIVASGPRADIDLSGGGARLTVGTWQDAPSDRRLKTRIVPIDSPLTYLARIQGCYYDRLDTYHDARFPAPSPFEYGLIADEVAAALPEAATTFDFGDGRGPLLNYTNRAVLALLVSAVNALRERVETLEH